MILTSIPPLTAADQHLAQVNGKPSAADDHHGADLRGFKPDGFDHVQQVVHRGGNVYVIPGFQPELAVRDRHLPRALYRADQYADFERFIQVHQRKAVHLAAFPDRKLYDFRPAFGKGIPF